MKHHTDKPEPVKEMTQTFQENMQEINLHEMHVKKMQKLLEKTKQGEGNYDSQELWDYFKTLDRENHKEPHFVQDLLHQLQPPQRFSEDNKIFEMPKSLHFNSQEASELLKSVSDEDWGVDENHLKFNHDLLVKKFGFFPVEDEEEDDVIETERPFSFSEKVVLDYQTGVAVFAVTTIVVFFLAMLCYFFRVTKGSPIIPDGKCIVALIGNQLASDVPPALTQRGTKFSILDLLDLIFWKLSPQNLSNKSVPSTIYKTTTEVIGKESSGNYKYLERIIHKAGKLNSI